MKLVVDIGNTLVKYAIFQQEDIIHIKSLKNFDEVFLSEIHSSFPLLKSAIISSVRNDDLSFLQRASGHLKIFEFNNQTAIPIRNRYRTPETLGKDRLAGAVGAFNLYPENDLLIIDAGTSITYDVVTKNGDYLGGGISPGIQMRYKALHTFTGKLPLVKPQLSKEIDMIGSTTENAILSGVQFAILREVEGMISAYQQKFTQLQILITGGDYKYFDKYLKNNIFAAPNLVLLGLKKILDFNEED